MKCEFCRATLSEGEISCSECGSLVRNFISEKSNTVISIRDQIDISKYKMSSDYRISEETSDNELPIVDVSRQTFVAQKTISQNAYKKNMENIGVVISADSNNINEHYRPSTKTYTMKNNNSKNVQNAETNNYSRKKISLRKDTHKVQLSKKAKQDQKVRLSKNPEKKAYVHFSKQSARNYIDTFGSNEDYENNLRNAKLEWQNFAEVPPELSKAQFMKLNCLSSVRASYYWAIVFLYLCMVGLLIVSVLIESLYNLMNVILLMALTFGLQFKTSYFCAWCCTLFGLVYSITGSLFYQNAIGLPIMIAGILAVTSLNKFNNLWEQYQSTGRVPYINRNL